MRHSTSTSCPRVVAPYIVDGRFVTCGGPNPCPEHGAPLFVTHLGQTDAGER